MRKSINEAETLPQEQVQSQNINNLTVAEAKRLGCLIISPDQAEIHTEIYNFGLKKVKDAVKNTNFESEDSKTSLPIKEAS